MPRKQEVQLRIAPPKSKEKITSSIVEKNEENIVIYVDDGNRKEEIQIVLAEQTEVCQHTIQEVVQISTGVMSE